MVGGRERQGGRSGDPALWQSLWAEPKTKAQ